MAHFILSIQTKVMLKSAVKTLRHNSINYYQILLFNSNTLLQKFYNNMYTLCLCTYKHCTVPRKIHMFYTYLYTSYLQVVQIYNRPIVACDGHRFKIYYY